MAKITREALPAGISEEAIQGEIQVQLDAGAIRAWVEEEGGVKYLYAEWEEF